MGAPNRSDRGDAGSSADPATLDTANRIERALVVAAAIEDAVWLAPTARVIDVGAGTGLLGRALAPRVGSVLLIDRDPAMTRAAAAAVTRMGLANVETRCWDLTAELARLGSFDIAVSVMAFHHIPDTTLALQRLVSLIVPGGWLALADIDPGDGRYHDGDADDASAHPGLDRAMLGDAAKLAGFAAVTFADVWEVTRGGRVYTMFLMTARRP